MQRFIIILVALVVQVFVALVDMVIVGVVTGIVAACFGFVFGALNGTGFDYVGQTALDGAWVGALFSALYVTFNFLHNVLTMDWEKHGIN